MQVEDAMCLSLAFVSGASFEPYCTWGGMISQRLNNRKDLCVLTQGHSWPGWSVLLCPTYVVNWWMHSCWDGEALAWWEQWVASWLRRSHATSTFWGWMQCHGSSNAPVHCWVACRWGHTTEWLWLTSTGSWDSQLPSISKMKRPRGLSFRESSLFQSCPHSWCLKNHDFLPKLHRLSPYLHARPYIESVTFHHNMCASCWFWWEVSIQSPSFFMKQFLQAARLQRLTVSPSVPQWDLSVVLGELSHEPYAPAEISP